MNGAQENWKIRMVVVDNRHRHDHHKCQTIENAISFKNIQHLTASTMTHRIVHLFCLRVQLLFEKKPRL